MLKSVRDVIISVLRAHLVELLENNRAELEAGRPGRINAIANIDKLVADFLDDIQRLSLSIVREGSGISLQVDLFQHVSQYVDRAKSRLGLRNTGEAA